MSISPAVDTLPITFAILDQEGVIVDVNDSWIAFARENDLGHPDAYVGEEYLSAVDEDASETARRAGTALRQLLAGERASVELEYPCHGPEERRWFSLRAGAFREDGQRYVAVGHVDVTEQKRREYELELNETLLENRRGIAVLFDEEGEAVHANDRFETVTGLPKSALVGRRFDDLPPAIEDRVRSADQLGGLVSQVLWGDLQIASTEIEFEDPGGDHVTATARVVPHRIDADTGGAILTALDITERKARQDQLRLYERAIQGSSELLAAIDRDYEYLFANEAYRDFFGVPDPTEVTVTIADVVEDDALDRTVREVERAFRDEFVTYTAERVGGEGNRRPFAIRYYPLRDRDGSIVGVVGALRDISKRKERERQLLVLDRVFRHNVHNDMNVIAGYADLVRRRTDDERVFDHATTVEETAHALIETVDKQREVIDLLTEDHEIRRTDVVDSTTTVAESYRREYPEATIDVEAPDRPVHAEAVPQFDVALDELVENAITHVDRDRPRIGVTVEARENSVRIAIEDDGPGIPEDEWRVLTDDRRIGPLYHGSGMGLWMVDWIVSRSGGDLAFDASDEGTRVIVDLPEWTVERP
ncbi:MAG: PAS domain-containing protein [Halanaeroarchaeum sp.]